MSMLDSFFNKGFKATKCKTLLKLTIPRIKLIRNRREAQIKQMRREIAKLLETGQEATARIRVEHIVREEKMMAAQEILELFCELIAVRLPIIEAQRECPLDLKEAISSVCFAAPRCSDLTELQQVQMLFVSKYGKEFVAAASELKPDSGVNRKLVELLSVRAPAAEVKLKLLKEIAEEHQLDWDPASTETDLFKSHEDLLNGPKQFGGGTKLPLPEEQDEGPRLTSLSAPKEHSDSDSDYEKLDFPEVPTASLRPTSGHTPENAPGDVKPASKRDEHSVKASHIVMNSMEKQDVEQPSPVVSFSQHVTESDSMKRNDYSPPSAGVVGSLSSKESGSSTGGPRKISDMDLQDVLMAAQTAADSAERAAAAARSAASLAQLRINELTKKTYDQTPESPSENPFYAPSSEKPQVDHQTSSVSNYRDRTELQREETSSLFSHEHNNHQSQKLPSVERPQFDHQYSSVSSYGDLTEVQREDTSSLFSHERNNHQSQRLPSTERPQFDHQDSSVSSYGDLTEVQREETSSLFSHERNNHQSQRLPSTERPQFDHQDSSVSSYGDLTEVQREETSSLFSHERNNHQSQRLPSTERPQFDHQDSSVSSYGDLTDLQREETSSLFSHERNDQPQSFPSIERPWFDHQNSSVSSYGDLTDLQRPEASAFDRRSPDQDHQQMRLPHMEDDPYYSYPNLFTPGSNSVSDKTKSTHDS